MVRSTTSWICGKCSKRFRSYREAEDCEIDHIVKDAANSFREDLAKILGIDATGQHQPAQREGEE